MAPTLFFAVWMAVAGQASQPTYVWMEHVGEDATGTRLVYETKEILRQSQGMRLSATQSASAYTVVILTRSIRLKDQSEEAGIAYAVVVTHTSTSRLMRAWLDTISSDGLKDRAVELVARVDKVVAPR